MNHLDPSEPGLALSPKTTSKQEFGRSLQKILHDRDWKQADLARAIQAITGKAGGHRDMVSTYVNGRSAPTPHSLELLCKALNMTREELYPNAFINATQDEHAAFEIRVPAGRPGQAWVRLNRMMSFDTAMEIGRLLNLEDSQNSKSAPH